MYKAVFYYCLRPNNWLRTVNSKTFGSKVIFFLLLLFNTCLAQAQIESKRTISIQFNKVSLVTIIKAIEEKADVVIMYEVTPRLEKELLSVSLSNKTVSEILDAITKGRGLKWTRQKDVYRIFDETSASVVTPAKPSGQRTTVVVSHQVSGIVSDRQSLAPIVGASVFIKGTKTGTTTRLNGEYSINVEPGQILSFSYIGYDAREVPVGNSTSIDVQLQVSDASMKDVVVTGLFTRKTESFTGSVTTYSSQDLLNVGNSNVIKSLANLDPSFRVMDNLQFGSDPNRLPDIQMRGQTGLPDLNNEYGQNPNLPLFILDGFETTIQRVIDLDMYLVKSITLLKDAASKAAYGSRAANGVVVIETKMPPPGKLQITYNYNLNIETPDLSSYNLTNAAEKLEVEMAADPILNDPMSAGSSVYSALLGYNQKRERVLQGVNTYWLSQPLRNGIGNRHSVNIGGGTREFRYNVELGYNGIAGVMKGSGRKVYSGGVTMRYRFNKISVSNILRLSSARGDNSPYGSFQQFVHLNPYERLYDSASRRFERSNPMYNGNIGVKDFTVSNLLSNNLELIWQPLSALKINGRIGISKTTDGGDVFLPATHNSFPAIVEPGGTTGGIYTPPQLQLYGRYTKSEGDLRLINATVTASYNRIFGVHNLFLNAGADANETTRSLYLFTVTGFPNPALDFPAAAMRYAENSKLNGSHNINRDMGMYGALNYSLKERYLLDGTFRITRSSQFGKNDPFGKFWSVGIGWNLHKESFIGALGWFDQLRLTANTGFTGTQALITNATLPTYSYNLAESYFNTLAATVQRLANPDLQAQRRQDNNISLSASVLNNALNIGVDYYISHTDGLLTDLNTPLSNGFTTYKANLGKAENRGFDIRINYQQKLSRSEDNFLSLFLTVGHNKNILKELSNSVLAFTTQQDTINSKLPKTRFAEGQSMSAIWAVPSIGIDPATGKEVFVTRDGNYTYLWNVKDQIVAGDNLPRVFGNFGFSFRMKGWQFSSSFAYNLGGQRYNQTLVDRVENANIAENNVDKRVFTSRWRQPGDISMFKSITDLSATYPTTRFVQDWNEVSIASLNLSYDLERLACIRSLGIKRLRVTAIMNNPAIFSSIRQERGIDYPFSRTFSFSIQTNF